MIQDGADRAMSSSFIDAIDGVSFENRVQSNRDVLRRVDKNLRFAKNVRIPALAQLKRNVY